MNYEERDTYGIYKTNKTRTSSLSSHQGPGPELMGAETLLGNEVYNRDREHLGDIKEIMPNTKSGDVSYAVLSFGGILGLGDKLFATPWKALKLDTVNKCFVLNVAKESLNKAPGFNKDNWPDMADPTWMQSISDYYQTSIHKTFV
jgi:sporulation protein YlmC with PRC-barrel domain